MWPRRWRWRCISLSIATCKRRLCPAWLGPRRSGTLAQAAPERWPGYVAASREMGFPASQDHCSSPILMGRSCIAGRSLSPCGAGATYSHYKVSCGRAVICSVMLTCYDHVNRFRLRRAPWTAGWPKAREGARFPALDALRLRLRMTPVSTKGGRDWGRASPGACAMPGPPRGTDSRR
jgi:hypothetical protein